MNANQIKASIDNIAAFRKSSHMLISDKYISLSLSWMPVYHLWPSPPDDAFLLQLASDIVRYFK